MLNANLEGRLLGILPRLPILGGVWFAVVKEEVGFLTDISESKAKRLMEFLLAQQEINIFLC